MVAFAFSWGRVLDSCKSAVPRFPFAGPARRCRCPHPSFIFRVSGLLCTSVLLAVFILADTSSKGLEPLRLLHRHILRGAASYVWGPGSSALSLNDWAAAAPQRSCILDLRKARRKKGPNVGNGAQLSQSQRVRCCLRSLRKEFPLALTARDSDILRLYGFSAHFRARLPKKSMLEWTGGGLKTCAVVSSAPSLRRSKFATNLSEEIDSADAVFRLNKAPIRGYERWVGSKETFRIINLHRGVARNRHVVDSYRKRGTAVFVRDEMYERRAHVNTSRSWNVPRLGTKGALTQYLGRLRKFPAASIFLNHPVFSELSLRFLHTSLVGGSRRALSTGAQAIVLAMLLCDKVTSYEVTSTDPASMYWEYYWSEKKRRGGYSWWHPFDEEASVLEELASSRRPNTTIYEYNMVESSADSACTAYLDSL